MLPPEGPDEDGGGSGPPLPPEDRLWRHPSEIGAGAVPPPGPPVGSAAPPPPASRGASSSWLVGAVSGVAGAALTLGVLAGTGGLDREVNRTQVVERVAPIPASTLPVSSPPGADVPGSVATLAAAVRPAVARVEVTRAATAGAPGAETTTTIGSAVAFRDDGFLLTSADLVDHSLRIVVVLDGGRATDGRIVGTDPLTDVAVLSIEETGLDTAVLGTAEDLTVGQPALVVGSASTPGALPAVTAGIVSALGRTLGAEGDAPPRHGLIQTDAPLDPTATGGPVLDRRGAVVGITTAPPTSVTGHGLSYAVPIDTARRVAGQIIGTGSVHHPWLGIEGSDLRAGEADAFQLAGGARVATVSEGSPADLAGLQADDVVTAVGETRVTSMAELVVRLREYRPGDVVLLSYQRAGQPGFCVATLAERA